MPKRGDRRVLLISCSAVLLTATGVVGGWAMSGPHLGREGGTGHEVAAAPALPGPLAASTPTTAPSDPPALIATLDAPIAYSAVPGGPPVGNLPATNPFGGQEVLAIVGVPDSNGWAEVELPIRPNGSVGYIQTAAVTLTETTYQVEVNVESDTLTVRDAGQVVLQVPAAVGKPSSPTPEGRSYLWELIRPDNPSGAYGPYIFGLALFSDTFAVFNGGDAQIGIHGQDEPASVGHPVSHGCVRLENSVITQLAGMLPLGTPVVIS